MEMWGREIAQHSLPFARNADGDYPYPKKLRT